MKPGDTARIEIHSVIEYPGFTNDFSGAGMLENGSMIGPALPGLGYDEGDELLNNAKRKEFHLPRREKDAPGQQDSAGLRNLLVTDVSDLITMGVTVSTSADQVAIVPGVLKEQWQQGGRRYYHYVQDSPRITVPFAILTARYAVLSDSVKQADGENVNIECYYHPTHSLNLSRMTSALKDGLKYFSGAYGPYQFKQIRLAEYPPYRQWTETFTNTIAYSEYCGFGADFTSPDQFDYAYFYTAVLLAQQWVQSDFLWIARVLRLGYDGEKIG